MNETTVFQTLDVKQLQMVILEKRDANQASPTTPLTYCQMLSRPQQREGKLQKAKSPVDSLSR